MPDSYKDLTHSAAQIDAAVDKANSAVQPTDLGTAATADATDFATATQGAKADSAVQPEDLGTAALADTTDFATATQGAKADTAVQPEDLGTAATADTTDFATAAQGGKADSAIQGLKVNSSTITPDSDKIISITIPTSASDVNALPNTTKFAAAIDLSINSSTYVMTVQLKDQNGDNIGSSDSIDLPLETMVVGGSYDSTNKKVILTLKNGETIEFSVADLVSGLQTELSSNNKLNPAYIAYDSTHRAVSDTEKTTWNGKQSALSSTQLDAVNSGIDSTKVDQIETNKNNISSLNTEIDTVANLGAKNFLDFNQWASKIAVYNGTKSYSNGVLTVTATGSGSVTYHNQYFPEGLKIPVKEGEKYTITWDTTVTTNIGFFQLCPNGNAISGTDVSIADKQTEYTVASGVTYLTYRVGVWASGNSINISKLMLRPATISDSSYQPYALPNSDLTALSAEDRASLVELVDGGAKNIVQIGTAVTVTKNGVTAVSNTDGSVTISGVSTSGSQFLIINDLYSGSTTSTYSSQIPIKAGNYVVKATGTRDVLIQAINYNSSTDTEVIDSSNDDVEFTATKSYIVFRLVIRGNTDFTTPVTIYPMCCDSALYAISPEVVPYRPSYQELTERTTIYTVESSLFSYVDTLSEGIHFARQNATTGTDKPVSGKRYMYQIFVYNSYFATITAYEGQSTSAPIIYTVNKENGTWGSWYKFEGTAVT